MQRPAMAEIANAPRMVVRFRTNLRPFDDPNIACVLSIS
jgi:hypothetical protein